MGGKIDVSKNDGRTPPMFIMNGENYHNIGSLLPLPCRQPKFAQLYIHDTDNEILNSLSIFGWVLNFNLKCILLFINVLCYWLY